MLLCCAPSILSYFTLTSTNRFHFDISSIIIDESCLMLCQNIVVSNMNVQIFLQKGIQRIASSTSTARLLIFGKIPKSPKFLVRFYILGSTGLVAQSSIWLNFASTRLYFTLKNVLPRLKMPCDNMTNVNRRS